MRDEQTKGYQNEAFRRYPASEANRLSRFALEEARVNRNELEKFYESAAQMIGETRYHFLWRLTQLERACAALEHCAILAFSSHEDWEQIGEKVATLSLQAVELRQEGRLLLNAYQRAAEARRAASRAPVEEEPIPVAAGQM